MMKDEQKYEVTMEDNTPEEVGAIICKLHETIQRCEPGWEKLLNDGTSKIGSWLHHPLRRNWDLIEKIERMLNDHAQRDSDGN